MTNIQSIDAYIAQCFAGKNDTIPLDADIQVATTNILYTGSGFNMALLPFSYTFPALPAGISAYRVKEVDCYSTVLHHVLLGKIVHFGTLDISSNVYTQDATMPTYTEGNNSNVTWSAVFVSVNTALNATPGSFTFTYTNQSGTAGVVSPSMALTASAVVTTAGYGLLSGTDCGASAVTSATRTGGTTPTGKLDFWGMIPICSMATQTIANVATYKSLHLMNPGSFTAGDVIRAFSLGSFAVRRIIMNMKLVGDT